MKLILPALAAVALAIFALSVPAPIITSQAHASRMNGKGSMCSDGPNCMSARYKAATKTKTKAPTKSQ
jgi:hypothetical protein